MNQVDPSCVGHKCSRDSGFRSPISRKEPSYEIDGGEGHAHTEENAGENAFRAAFAEGEGESGDDNRDERKSARDGAGERLLENAHGVFPRRVASGLREDRHGKEETDSHGQQETGTRGKKPKTVVPILRHSFSIQLRKCRTDKPARGDSWRSPELARRVTGDAGVFCSRHMAPISLGAQLE